MARIRQFLSLRRKTAKNKNARYKMKYTYIKNKTSINNKKTNKYTYTKRIVSKKKYSYKYRFG